MYRYVKPVVNFSILTLTFNVMRQMINFGDKKVFRVDSPAVSLTDQLCN